MTDTERGTAGELPENYPFDATTPYTGALAGAEAMVAYTARGYARDGLTIDDFARPPEREEEELNAVLGDLRHAVQEAAVTLSQPGPWHGLAEGDDVALAAAKIGALVQRLAMPTGLAEAALIEAYNTALDRQQGEAFRKGRKWRARREFEDRVAEGIRNADSGFYPLELRLAHMDKVIAEAQSYRAAIAQEHYTDEWLRKRRDDESSSAQ